MSRKLKLPESEPSLWCLLIHQAVWTKESDEEGLYFCPRCEMFVYTQRALV